MDDFINSEYIPEPFLLEDSQQLTFYPIKKEDEKYFLLYKNQLAAFWTIDEIDMSNDKNEFDKLPTSEKQFLSLILAFFAASDQLVILNLTSRFLVEIKNISINRLFSFQTMMETIHSEMYSILLDTYILDTQLKDYYLNSIKEIPTIKKKGKWVLKWIESEKSLSHRIIANTINEGIFFSGSFCAIYWFGEKNVLSGLRKSNKLISNDESMHCLTGYTIYNDLKNKLSEQVVFEMVREAVEIESEFICDILPEKLNGMNSSLMVQYIKYVADILLVNFGYKKLYSVTNPFHFMEKIGLQTVSNFFEVRAVEYQKKQKQNDDDDNNISIGIKKARNLFN